MYLRLKDEIFFMLHKSGVEVYFGNKQLNKLINTDNNSVFFDFLRFITVPRSYEEIKEYRISEEEKKDIIEFLVNNKYAIWEDEKRDIYSRSELFVNTYPNTNYDEVKNTINSINILLIGLGTAGSYVLEILTKLGFNSFYLVDGDIVQTENLESQFFSERNLNKYKAEIIKSKYPRNKVIFENIYLENSNDINRILSDNSFDYIINCADDYRLTGNLLLKIIDENYKFSLIESGYGPLLQQTYIIKSKKRAEKFYGEINKLKNKFDTKEMLARNNGSIFNAWLSAFSIGKIIFDDVIGFDDIEVGEFDFLQNRYYLGNRYNKVYFDYFSKLIQTNMKYSLDSKDNINSKNKISKENIFDVNDNKFDLKKIDNLYVKEFLYTKNNIEDFVIYEELYDTLSNFKFSVNKNIESYIIENFIIYASDNFNIDLNKLKDIIDNNIFENYHKNSRKQHLIKKIEQKYIIFNQDYSNEYEKILIKIHELLHYIYYDISDSEFEHENFVMTNEIRFYYSLLKKEESLLDFIAFYFLRLIKNHITNFIALDYEKGLLNNDLCDFKSNNKLLISTDIDSMVRILNTKINFNKPFYSLKYFRSFNNNKEAILFIIENILNI